MNTAVVSSILKEGTVVSTKLDSDNSWYPNIIYKSECNSVCVALIGKHLESMIYAGANLSLKYSNEYFIYFFEGRILQINTAYPAFILVQINKAEEIVNTRLYTRYDTNLAAGIKPVWDDVRHFSIVTNISLGGMAFLSTYKFDNGEECEACISLPGQKDIGVRGKIVRSSIKARMNDFSFQFTGIDSPDKVHLSHYLSTLEDEMTALQNHFYTEIKGKLG